MRYSDQLVKASSFVLCFVLYAVAINRPAAPTITGVSYNNGHIVISGSKTAGDSCHAVLVSDLSPSLDYAYEIGNSTIPLEGPAINFVTDNFPIRVPVGSQSRERYFVAVAVSTPSEGGQRIFSGWKMSIDDDGLPLPVSTPVNLTGENLFYRARKVKNQQVVLDLSFSIPKIKAAGYNLKINRNGSSALEINNLADISNSRSNIRAAIENVSLINGNSLVLKRDDGEFYLYNIYTFFSNYVATDSLSAMIVDANGMVYDTTTNRIGVFEDVSHMDIISTIYDLLKITSDDPIYPGTLGTIDAVDTLKAKLLIAAMVDLSIPHNSPVPDPNEAAQGIFTNYIQFMDNVVKNWGDIKGSGIGMPHLREIHQKILDWNDGVIIDPVETKNLGTCFEPVISNQKRKNYAFDKGYSRVNWTLSRPNYGALKSGAGVMFRISENIGLFGANITQTTAAFDSLPFLNGSGDQRFIFRANNEQLNQLVSTSGGVWVKGIQEAEINKFYIGISPVRVSIMKPGCGTKTDSAFSITNEEKGKEDPEGTIERGVERNVLKIKPIVNNQSKNDTINETYYGNMLIHGGKRKITYDNNYLGSGVLKYELVGDPESKQKVNFYQTGTEAILEDKGVFNSLTIMACTYFGTTLTCAIPEQISSKHVCLRDADLNGNYELLTDGLNVISIAVANSDELISPEKPEQCPVTVEWSNGLKVYKSAEIRDQNLLWPPPAKKAQSNGTLVYSNWNSFKTNVLETVNTLHIVCSRTGKSVVRIIPKPEENSSSEIIPEKIEIINPELQIKDNKNTDLTVSGKLFNAKKNGPIKIDIVGCQSDNVNEYIKQIRIDVLCDASNSDHTGFYGGNNNVYSTTRTYNSKQDVYSIEWDGRDNRNSRILLGGTYTIAATISTSEEKSVVINKQITFAIPQIVTVGMNYPVDESLINTFINRDRQGSINWNAVDFLNKKLHSDFKWLNNYTLAMALVDKETNYSNTNLKSVLTNNNFTLPGAIEDNAAIYRFMGHHAIEGVIGEVILGGGKYIYSHCGEGTGSGFCANKKYCIDVDCNNNMRGAFMDDVLLAVAVGCQTDVGLFSTAQSMINAGADCAIGTQIQVSIPLLIFWNVFFWRNLNDGSSISDAASNAFDEAVEKLLAFTGYPDVFTMSTHLPGISTYTSTMSIKNNPANPGITDGSILPARYGAKTGE